VTVGLLLLPASAPGAVTDISDRQETESCRYARASASIAKREGYADACRTARSAEHRVSGVTAAAAASLTYENPVYGSSFPDPGVLQNGSNDYYAYATGSGFPIIKSADLVHWAQVGRAFPRRPSWVVPTGDSHPWAPSVLRSPGSCPGTTSPGCYFMYYGGLSAQHTPTTHCVGVAWSLTPSGPFTDLGPIQAEDGETDLAGRPPGCGDAGGYGPIDAAPFVDSDGSVYLYVSTSRRCAQPTTQPCPYEPVISVFRMTSTPTRAASDRIPLFGATPSTWEQRPGHAAQVENPWMEKRGSTYYLFYSGGDYRASYGMGYATASSPTGEPAYPAFAKSPLNPILSETAAVLSPGGGSVTIGPDGGSWLVYHGRAGDYSQPRTLRIDPLVWSDTSVSTPGPTTGRQTFSRLDTPTAPGTTPDSGSANTVAPSADLTAPGLTLGGRRRQRARRTIRVIVRATSEALWATASGAVRIGGSKKAYALRGAGTSFVEPGTLKTLKLRISRKALLATRRGLRRHRIVTARLVIEALDPAGNSTVRKRTIKLIR
jgi:Glycosyl hydrolases family 43